MNELEQLKQRIQIMETFIQNLQKGFSIPLEFDQALQGRGFFKKGGSNIWTVAEGGTGAITLTGILKGNGISPITTVAPLSGNNTFWVAASSGGATTKGVNITDGIVVSFS